MGESRKIILVTWPRFDLDDPQTAGRLKSAGFDVRHAPKVGPRTPAQLIELLGGAVGVIASTDPFTAEVFAEASDLRVIARTGVGLDTIDLPAAEAAGVTVLTTPGANHSACADHTIALMLSVIRRVTENDAAIRRGVWDRAGRLSGGELTGARVGIVGFGRIGRAVARRLEGFECEVRVCDPHIEGSCPYPVVSLVEVMRWSDIVSLHVPLSDTTTNLIGAAELALARPGIVLINTARGGIVDDRALADALRAGRVAAAGLDVFTTEPPNGSPLLELSNVTLSPHIAGLSEQSMRVMVDQCIDGVLSVLVDEAVVTMSKSAPADCRIDTWDIQ